MATRLDLADAQFIGFSIGKNNWNAIIELVESMGLTKREWIKWKELYPAVLSDSNIEAIDRHFGLIDKN